MIKILLVTTPKKTIIVQNFQIMSKKLVVSLNDRKSLVTKLRDKKFGDQNFEQCSKHFNHPIEDGSISTIDLAIENF